MKEADLMLEIAAPSANQATQVNDAKNWPIWWPILVILFTSVLIREFDLDRMVSKPWYNASQGRWPLERSEPFYSFYLYGVYPPLVLGGVGLFAACFGPLIWRHAEKNRLKSLRAGGLFLVLMLAIGPGLIVNGCLKALWGRPRPIQCKDFGGELDFKPVGQWTVQEASATSFASGHASIAFFLMGPGFLFHPYRTGRWRGWFLLGLGYGSAMGFTRIMQGGHFLSDVLWAGLIVYLVGVILARLMLRYE
jgi:membrane-associated PAP2 superfamily phosphatase